jgi:diaminopimelate decarboxylase
MNIFLKFYHSVKMSGTVIARLHTHIGSGTDPMEWISTLETTLDIAERLPDVTNVSIGGGFKSRYMPGEHDADMTMIAEVACERG